MKINPSLKTRPTASLFIFSSARLSVFAAALLSLVSFSSGRADVWLNETFEQYTVATPATAPTQLSSLLLQQISSGSTVVGTPLNQMCRYYKPTATALTVAGLQYSLSPANATARPKGYISFKVVQNTPPSPAIASSDFSLRLGSNDSTTMGGSASAFIDVRFTPSVSPATTCAFSVRSGGDVQKVITTVSATAQNTIKIWYNSENVGMAYTDPAGNAQTLSAASYVCYVNNVLASSSASGTALLGVVTTSASTVIPPVTSSVIGKLAFQCASSKAVDFSVDDIYAADSAPVLTTPPMINSATSSTGFQNLVYSYQITADQTVTSYALTGTLPDGLTFDTATGIISGTPNVLGTTSNISLTATNANGTSAAVSLAITIMVPVNTFSGSTASLSTAASWSLGASPNSSTSTGSYQDVTLAASVTDLTTPSSALWAKSWNVINGSSYTLTSGKTDGSSIFKMGITSPTVTTFANTVSGVNNDLVYLANSSSLTFSPLNSINALTPSKVELSNSGNLNIGSGSTLNLDAVTTGSFALTKTGAGTVGLSAANTYSGGTTLSAGTINISGTAAPTRLAQVKANVTGGVVTSYTVIDGGAGYTAVPTVSVGKNTGEGTVVTATATATIDNGAVTAVTVGVGGSGYTLAPKVQIQSNQSPLGTGAVTLRDGTLNASVDTDLSRMTFYPDPTNTFFRITGSDTPIYGPVTLDVAAGKTLSSYALVSDANAANLITKNGEGTLWLRGGGQSDLTKAFAGGFRVNAGTLSISVTSNSGTGTGTITMNGGNLRIGKGVGSTGIYSGLDMDNAISVLADTTITLDPNPLTPTESNLASAAVLRSKASKTITVAKSSTANAGAQMIFRSAELEGTTTFNVADATQVALGGATGIGMAGVTKTGLGTLMLSVLDSTTSAIVNNTYTGTTAINAGTVVFYPGSSQASSISVANNAVAQFTLGNVTPITSGSLTLSSGSKVRIIGAPSNGTSYTYTLFTAAGGITGTPALEAPINGYSLAIEGTSLVLKAATSDTTPPVITVLGANPLTVAQGSVYTDAGASTDDGSAVTANIPANITSTVGSKTVTYDSVDTSGNNATQKTRTVIVTDQTAPVLALNGANPLSVSWGGVFTDPGASFTDNVDASKTVISLNTVDTSKVGSTILTYSAVDAGGNAAVNVTRTVTVTLPNGGTTVGADGLSDLMRYALGGTSPSSKVELPTVAVTSTTLTMNALIRIDDLKVSVVGIYGLVPGSWVTGSPITGVPSSSQTGAVAGVTQRQDFSVLRGTDSKKFMYLKATQQAP